MPPTFEAMESEPSPAGPSWTLPEIASQAAQRRLAQELVQRGFSELAASAVSRAVVDPTDFRRRLSVPTFQRTSTGSVLTVGTHVWSPLVSVYPDNKRDAVDRPLPIGRVPVRVPPLPELRSDAEEPNLTLHALSREQLSLALRRAEAYLLEHNSLEAQIREEGVLRPLTVIAIEAAFASGEPSLAFISSADGSSRTASAHRILGIDAGEVLYQFTEGESFFRQHVDGLASGTDALDVTGVLVVPADVVVGIQSRTPGPNSSARAIRTLVGLLHVQPPTSWTPGAQLDAQGEEVLSELATRGVIDDTERRYLAGLMTFEEALAAELPSNPDERAALILALFRDNLDAVKVAVKRITHVARVGNARIANVATELAIRSFRGDPDHSTPEQTSRSRVGLQLAYRLREIWRNPWAPTDRTPLELRDAALLELEAGRFGPARTELAVKGAFELARAKVLTQYSLRKGVEVTNLASPSAILRTMTSSKWGIDVLYQAMTDGRNGAARFTRVIESGEPDTSSGRVHDMTADWLRDSFDPAASPPAIPGGTASTPETAYAERQDHIRAMISSLTSSFETLRELQSDSGRRLVDVLGWRAEDARGLITSLERLRDELNRYAYARQRSLDEDGDAEISETSDDDEDWS